MIWRYPNFAERRHTGTVLAALLVMRRLAYATGRRRLGVRVHVRVPVDPVLEIWVLIRVKGTDLQRRRSDQAGGRKTRLTIVLKEAIGVNAAFGGRQHRTERDKVGVKGR